MKDTNDTQTIDWVGDSLIYKCEACFKFHSNEFSLTCESCDVKRESEDTLVIAPPVNPALYAALNTIINRTINDLLTNQQEHGNELN